MHASCMIVAGEASGDLYGARLAQALQDARPDLELFGAGGPRMAAAGVDVAVDLVSRSVIGLAEVFASLPNLFESYRATRALLERGPSTIVFIDYPGFNLRLARVAHRLGFRCLYFIPPKLWAWKEGRAAWLLEYTDEVFPIFPFEGSIFDRWDIPWTFLGHPMVDVAPDRLPASRCWRVLEELSGETASEAFREGPILTLLPGSRRSELKSLGRLFLETAAMLRRRLGELSVLLPVAPSLGEETFQLLRDEARRLELPIVISPGGVHQALSLSTACLAASGTVTLEAAFLNTPMVIAYASSAPTYAAWLLARRMPWIGLPNILAGREICPERVQGQARPEFLRDALAPLFESEEAHSTQRRDLAAVRQGLGARGVFSRLAERVLVHVRSVREGRCAPRPLGMSWRDGVENR